MRGDADTEGRSHRRGQRHAATGLQLSMFNATQRNTMNDEEQHQQSRKHGHPQFFTATILEWKSLLSDDAFKDDHH